jgi:hypothetical protein
LEGLENVEVDDAEAAGFFAIALSVGMAHE